MSNNVILYSYLYSTLEGGICTSVTILLLSFCLTVIILFTVSPGVAWGSTVIVLVKSSSKSVAKTVLGSKISLPLQKVVNPTGPFEPDKDDWDIDLDVTILLYLHLAYTIISSPSTEFCV